MIKEWLSAKDLSLNVGKTKFSLFHDEAKKYSIPFPLPTLKINIPDIERVNKMKLFGVLLDVSFSWKEHILERTYLQNKTAKNIELVYRVKPFLDKDSSFSMCYSYSQSYLNYANLAWSTAYRTNLEKLSSQQKRAF